MTLSTSNTVLTLEEVADYLRLSPEVVLRQATQGSLPGRLVEGTWRFHKTAINKWLSPSEPPFYQRFSHSEPIISDQDIQAAKARNNAFIALLESWDTPDQTEIQTETWQDLKLALDHDRLSDCPLFP
jgi:excisionase family DNA binding protein